MFFQMTRLRLTATPWQAEVNVINSKLLFLVGKPSRFYYLNKENEFGQFWLPEFCFLWGE